MCRQGSRFLSHIEFSRFKTPQTSTAGTTCQRIKIQQTWLHEVSIQTTQRDSTSGWKGRNFSRNHRSTRACSKNHSLKKWNWKCVNHVRQRFLLICQLSLNDSLTFTDFYVLHVGFWNFRDMSEDSRSLLKWTCAKWDRHCVVSCALRRNARFPTRWRPWLKTRRLQRRANCRNYVQCWSTAYCA